MNIVLSTSHLNSSVKVSTYLTTSSCKYTCRIIPNWEFRKSVYRVFVALFCTPPPPPPKFFESKVSLKVQTSLKKCKTSFHNRKITSIKIVFCLTKTFSTQFDYNYVLILFFVTQNRKLLISSSRMPNFIRKNYVN